MNVALKKGVNLKEYWKSTEKDLKDLQTKSLDEYMSDEILLTASKLHLKFDKALKTLDSAGTVVKGFQVRRRTLSLSENIQSPQTLEPYEQESLGDVSKEMKYLHEKCSSVRVKLKNREAILKHLNAFLSQVAVSSDMRNSLQSGTINDEFVENLKELNRKIAFVESSEDVGVGMTRAAHNVAPQLEGLRSHAVRHVRQYLNRSIQMLRKSKNGTRSVQRERFQRYHEFPKFLRAHAPSAAAEIEDNYINVLRAVFTDKTKQYHQALMRLTGEMATKNDMIVVDEKSRRSIFSGRQKVQRRNNALSLNDRFEQMLVLEQDNGWMEVEEMKRKAKSVRKDKILTMECTFRSEISRIVSTLTFEFLFLEHFFGSQRQTSIFRQVMGSCFKYHIAAVKSMISSTYVSLSFLLCYTHTHTHTYTHTYTQSGTTSSDSCSCYDPVTNNVKI